MRKLNVQFVVMVTKPLRSHFSRCDLREPKRPHAGNESQNTSRVSTKGSKIYLTLGKILFWILICAFKLVIPLIFADIQRVKIKLFN